MIRYLFYCMYSLIYIQVYYKLQLIELYTEIQINNLKRRLRNSGGDSTIYAIINVLLIWFSAYGQYNIRLPIKIQSNNNKGSIKVSITIIKVNTPCPSAISVIHGNRNNRLS